MVHVILGIFWFYKGSENFFITSKGSIDRLEGFVSIYTTMEVGEYDEELSLEDKM